MSSPARISDRIIVALEDAPHLPVALTIPEWDFILSELSRHSDNDGVTKKIRRTVRDELLGTFPNILRGPV